MFEQTFKNIDDVLWKEAGCTTELDYTEQTSWLLFLKYLDDLEQERSIEAELVGKPYEAKIKNMGNAGRNGGEYYTPRPLIRAMIQVLKPQIGDRVYDGACGSAGFLCETYDYLRQGNLTTRQLEQLQTETFTAKNVKMGYLQNDPMEFIDPATYDRWMTRGIPKKGDVLFTTEAPLGNVTQLDTDEKVVFAQRIIIMQPDRGVLDSTFLKYMLLSKFMQDRIHAKGTGAIVKGIKAQLLKKVKISFPRSLPEQKRIVSIVDEAFEAIDTAIDNTEQNLTNARELFDSYLNAVFTQKGDGWTEKKLREVCIFQGGSQPPKSVFSIENKRQPIIVSQLQELKVETQRLEAIYQQKLTALNELKQSILHKAFTGELTADKADLKINIEQEAIAV